MTTTTEHKRKPRRITMTRLILLCVVLCMLGVANLYRVQQNYQTCVANYLAADSAATHQRSGASVKTIKALVDQSQAVSVTIDPKHQPASEADKQAARDAIAAVPVKYHRYIGKVDRYPYPVYTCGGTSPKESR